MAAGARIVEGGTYDGLFYRPTVVVDVTPEMPVWSEEIFAPVAPVMAAASDEEALALTNDTDYGLVNAVLTGSTDRGLAFAERVESGMVHVNDSTCLDEAHVPFGGMGASGLGGRSGGRQTSRSSPSGAGSGSSARGWSTRTEPNARPAVEPEPPAVSRDLLVIGGGIAGTSAAARGRVGRRRGVIEGQQAWRLRRPVRRHPLDGARPRDPAAGLPARRR